MDAEKENTASAFTAQDAFTRNNTQFSPQLPGNNGMNGNPASNLSMNFVDYVGRSVGGLEKSLEAAAPGFIEDMIDGLGLEGKPVLVIILMLVLFYALYKFA